MRNFTELYTLATSVPNLQWAQGAFQYHATPPYRKSICVHVLQETYKQNLFFNDLNTSSLIKNNDVMLLAWRGRQVDKWQHKKETLAECTWHCPEGNHRLNSVFKYLNKVCGRKIQDSLQCVTPLPSLTLTLTSALMWWEKALHDRLGSGAT